MCEGLQKMLSWEHLGCNVPSTFINPLKAIDALEWCKPDLVISDLKMPVMDGKELCKQIIERYPEVEFVFLSAYEDFQFMQTALRYGVRGYILKPVCEESINQLEHIIKEIVKENKQSQWWERIFDSNFPNHISTALNERDYEFFECLFEDMFIHRDSNVKQVQHYMMYLLHLLLDYIRGDNFLKEYTVLGINDQKCIQRFYEFEDVERCISFVKNNYNEVLEVLSKNNDKQSVIEHINSLICENYMIPDFGVSWIADKMHLTPAYLSRIYSKHSENSLVENIMIYRIRKACELLRTTQMTINQVSVKVGYSNVCYFSKIFRTQTGETPSEYRKCNYAGSQKC